MKRTVFTAVLILLILALFSCASNGAQEDAFVDPNLANASSENASDEQFEELFGQYIETAQGPSIRKVLFHDDDENSVVDPEIVETPEEELPEEIPVEETLEPVVEEESQVEEEVIEPEVEPPLEDVIQVLEEEEMQSIIVADEEPVEEDFVETVTPIEEENPIEVEILETHYMVEEDILPPSPDVEPTQTQEIPVSVIESTVEEVVEQVPDTDWVDVAAARHEETWSMTTLEKLRSRHNAYWPYFFFGGVSIVLLIVLLFVHKSRKRDREDNERYRYNKQQESQQYDKGESITANPGVVEGVTDKKSTSEFETVDPGDDEERKLNLVSSTRYKVMDELAEYIPVAQQISDRFNALSPQERTEALLHAKELLV